MSTFMHIIRLWGGTAAALLLATLLGEYFWIHRHTEPRPHVWLNVFVHGSFNFPLGLLSMRNFLTDTPDGSTYSRVIKRVRRDPYFYQEQPILQRGLVRITPTITLPPGTERPAAYPILYAFEQLQRAVGEQLPQLWYTYGWSGLLSQRERRREALRLCNALREQLSFLRSAGYIPHIRLLAHSHGGNVCLNIATINTAVRTTGQESALQPVCEDISEQDAKITHNALSLDAHQSMQAYLARLPAETASRIRQGGQRFDYQPANPLYIDELILLGTPVQQETVHCFHDAITFGAIYHLYSEHDSVQNLDFISTKNFSSARRIPLAEQSPCIQTRIIVGLPHTSSTPEPATNWLWQFLGNTGNTSRDPAHNDLWFFAWNTDYSEPNFLLNPLPLVIIVPFLLDALHTVRNKQDLDLFLDYQEDHLVVDIHTYGQKECLVTKTLARSHIDTLREQLLTWRPINLSKASTFQAMRQQLASTP